MSVTLFCITTKSSSSLVMAFQNVIHVNHLVFGFNKVSSERHKIELGNFSN